MESEGARGTVYGTSEIQGGGREEHRLSIGAGGTTWRCLYPPPY
jgi:hypothetical protein